MTPKAPKKPHWRSALLLAGILCIALAAGCADDDEPDAVDVDPATGNIVDVYAATNPTPTPMPAFVIHGLVTPNPEASWEPVYTPPASAIQSQTPAPNGEPVEPEGTPPPATSTPKPTAAPTPKQTAKPTPTPATPKPTATPSPTGGLSMLMPSSAGNIVYVSPTPAATPGSTTTPAPTVKPTATPTPEPTPTAKPIQGTGSQHTFTATSIDGRSIDSESLFANADITMINMWGTHCGPCINEMPDLAKLHDAYSSKGVQVVGIVCDVNGKDAQLVETARNLIAQTGADYLHLMVSDSLKADLLRNLSVVPVTVFVDSEGRYLRDRIVGSRSYDGWKEYIDELLAMGKPEPTPTPAPTPYTPSYIAGST